MGTGVSEPFYNKIHYASNMERVIAKVEREVGEKNFSCYMKINNVAAIGQGSSAKEAIADMLRGWEDIKADCKEEGINIPTVNIEYTFDVGALLNYYDFINVAGMSREIGISPTLMRQYAIGQRKPSKQRKEMIVKGIKALAKKMEAASVY